MGIERHHIAGRAYGDETVDLCEHCHKLVTRWQRAAGIDLRKNVPHSDTERLRARLVGSALVAEIACRIYGRIMSRALNQSGNDGWTPSATYPRKPRDD
jgi:hypothetical protein